MNNTRGAVRLISVLGVHVTKVLISGSGWSNTWEWYRRMWGGRGGLVGEVIEGVVEVRVIVGDVRVETEMEISLH